MKRNLLILISLLTFNFSSHANLVSVNQAQLEYEVKGQGPQVVLFEAGAISGMAGWDSIWQQLPNNIKAIRYSRRGEGMSSACTGDLTAADYVKDLETLLAQLNVEQPLLLVSHSYGAKVARLFAAKHPAKVSSMLFVDPTNPRDVEIMKRLDPINGKASIEAIKQNDIKQGQENNWCLISDIWDKQPALGFGEIADIPITLIAGVKKYKQPKSLFDSDEARDLWGQYQAEWVEQFPQGKAVMAPNSGHFVQDDNPELVLKELNLLLAPSQTK